MLRLPCMEDALAHAELPKAMHAENAAIRKAQVCRKDLQVHDMGGASWGRPFLHRSMLRASSGLIVMHPKDTSNASQCARKGKEKPTTSSHEKLRDYRVTGPKGQEVMRKILGPGSK